MEILANLNKNRTYIALFLLLVILSGVILRFLTLSPELYGDEAVFGLMSKHIMEGREYPVYMWEAHYGGTLSAYIIAMFFRFFGVSAISYKIVGLLLIIPFVIVMYMLGKNVFNTEVGVITAFFTAISPVFVTNFSMVILGVYMEGLICGAMILLLCCRLISFDNNPKIFLFLGFISGLGLWLSPHVMPFLITALIIFWLKDKKIFFSKDIIFFLIFFLISYLPALIYNFQHPSASLYRFAGRVFELDRSVLAAPDFSRILFSKIIWRISTIPESLMKIPYLILPIIGLEKHIFSSFVVWSLIILIYAGSFAYIILLRKRLSVSKMSPVDVLIIFSLVFVIFYSCLVGEDRYRYLLPLYVVIPVFLSIFLLKIKKVSKALFFLLFTFILGVNLIGNLSNLNAKDMSYGDLVSFLFNKNIFYGYSDYFTAYPIVFASQEKIIVSPCAFDSFSERYPLYTSTVNSADEIAYIFNLKSHPWVTAVFEQRLKKLNVPYKKEFISPFIVYYNFSQHLSPDKLALKELKQFD